jgi:hypothetical protein
MKDGSKDDDVLMDHKYCKKVLKNSWIVNVLILTKNMMEILWC